MALRAQFAVGLEQQLLEFGLMRIMTGGTLAVFRRLVLHLGGGDAFLNVLVAFRAELAVRL